MTQEHPITPPSEGLVLQWSDEWYKAKVKHMNREQHLCMQAAHWGADQELEACCEWIADNSLHHADSDLLKDLRAARRPKPPSLKEQALETLLSMQIQPCVINGINTNADLMAKYDILRRALESLPD